MNRLIRAQEDMMCMSDVRGTRIKVEQNVPFSFYYSARNSSHGPRIKIVFDPNKIRQSKLSNLQLTGDWDFDPNPLADNIKSKEVNQARAFFRKYLILLLLAWEELLDDEASVRDFLEGIINIHQFVQCIDFYEDYKSDLDKVQDVSELEDFCRINDLVNFYGN